MAKKSLLADQIKASLPTRYQGTIPWYTLIDETTMSQLRELRREWQEGKLVTGAKTLAAAISHRLNEDGVSTIGYQGVLSWLKRKD